MVDISLMFYSRIIDRLAMRIDEEIRSGKIVSVYRSDDKDRDIVSSWFGSCSHISAHDLSYNYHYSIIEYCLFTVLSSKSARNRDYYVFDNIVTMVNALMNVADFMVRENISVGRARLEEIRVLSLSLFNSSLFDPSDDFNDKVKDFFSTYCAHRELMSMNLILQALNIPIVE